MAPTTLCRARRLLCARYSGDAGHVRRGGEFAYRLGECALQARREDDENVVVDGVEHLSPPRCSLPSDASPTFS